MSYFHRPAAGLDEPEASHEPPKSPFADVAGRFANWIAGVERMPDDDDGDEPMMHDHRGPDPMRDLRPTLEPEEPSRFPIAARGYDPAQVDAYVVELERENAELRARMPQPMSINEELARIGEQTASILVVAHDQAHETTRLAQEQAERCVADAAANAVAITNEAKQRLRELDTETDSVWRERERLLQDVRTVSTALAALADEAASRFPADPDDPSATVSSPTMAFPLPGGYSGAEDIGARKGAAEDPQPTVAFSPDEHREYGELADHAAQEPHGAARTGDTANWLTGLEPPDSAA